MRESEIFTIRQKIGQKQKDAPFDDISGKKEKTDSELEKYREEGQKFIDSHRRFFATFARDVSLSFKMSDGFYIDLENGEVNSDAKWFAERKFSKTKILWAHLHEIVHFRDFAEDPKGMLENFEYIEKRARETGALILQKWEKKYGASDPEFVERLKKQTPVNPMKPEKGTMNATERAAYKIYHRFYNIFDDIYDNNVIPRKAPLFESGTAGAREVEEIYGETLFPARDFSKSPRHFQFTDKLIREDMVKNEDAAVSEEIAEIFKKKIKFMGREWTPKEITDNFIKPKKNRDTKAGQRYYVLRQTLEPIFEELLLKDLEEWDPQKPEPRKGEKGELQEGGESGNPFEQDYKDYEKNNPDQISPEEIENWMKKNEEDKKNEEARKAREQSEEKKTAEERAEEVQEKLDDEWLKKNNISREMYEQFKKVEEEVAPYLENLSKLWRRIIFGSARKIERGMEGYFKTGSELDVPKIVEQWPNIEEGDFSEARIFKKMTQKEVLVRKPELIRVRLVGDMSGSMNSEKIHILQQCFILLLSSLQEFNTYLNFERSRTKSKLEADTEAWIFGDYAEQIKKLRSKAEYGDERAEIMKIFEKLLNTIGSTYDDKALESIAESLSSEDRKKIEQGKIMEIVFEITDGGSSNAPAAREALNKLLNDKVIARAFQIGSVSAEEKEIFNKVWNDGHEEVLGEIVGEKIENLLPAVTAVLKKYLSSVRL